MLVFNFIKVGGSDDGLWEGSKGEKRGKDSSFQRFSSKCLKYSFITFTPSSLRLTSFTPWPVGCRDIIYDSWHSLVLYYSLGPCKAGNFSFFDTVFCLAYLLLSFIAPYRIVFPTDWCKHISTAIAPCLHKFRWYIINVRCLYSTYFTRNLVGCRVIVGDILTVSRVIWRRSALVSLWTEWTRSLIESFETLYQTKTRVWIWKFKLVKVWHTPA